MHRTYLMPAVLLASTLACSAQNRAGNTGAERPDEVAFSDDKLKQLKVPPGFTVSVWAKDLGHPRMMALAPDHTVYITRRDEGDVIALKDIDGKGQQRRTVAKLADAHGITIKENKIYLTDVKNVYVADLQPDGDIGSRRKIIDWLGGGGNHPNRTLAFGPDGWLYITVGSTCNVCLDPEDENAVVLRTKADGSGREVFARGLRNTIGIDWHPQTKELWGMDNGSDWRGDDYPPEELNRIQQGKHYGWPHCLGDRKPDTISPHRPKDGRSKEQFCAGTELPVMGYTAHTAPIAFVFYYAGMFPNDYKGDAFVAMHGSWNRRPPTGYEVIRVNFEDGKPVKFEPFLSGFQSRDGKSVFGRPAGLLVLTDGSLLVGDDTSGVIYRIAYEKKQM
jgi:glucose/arabinose dehydrogenase